MQMTALGIVPKIIEINFIMDTQTNVKIRRNYLSLVYLFHQFRFKHEIHTQRSYARAMLIINDWNPD